MSSHDYRFLTRWRVPGRIEEVAAVLANIESLPRWWPSVYLECRTVARGDDSGVGRTVFLKTRGWLPYTLKWNCRVTCVEPPHRFGIAASGDFEGRGEWRLQQNGDHADVEFEWVVRAEKPLLRRFSFLLKTVFFANHRWAMARGEESLRLALLRRRTNAAGAVNRIPPPPGPSRSSELLLACACGAFLGIVTRLVCSSKEKPRVT